MRCDDSVFVVNFCRYELVEEAEEFVDLYFGEVGVVGGVFYFKGIHVSAFTRHNVWQRVEAWVADGHAHGIVTFLLQQLNQDGFAVEAAFAPTPKLDAVKLCTQLHSRLLLCRVKDKKCSLREQ